MTFGEEDAEQKQKATRTARFLDEAGRLPLITDATYLAIYACTTMRSTHTLRNAGQGGPATTTLSNRL